METRIISAFPGVGKTYYHERNKEISIDSDSSHFSWVKDGDGNNTKERNPEFPNNYISHIKENIGNYKYIFVSSHEEVRNALKENGIKYYMIYPAKSKKQEFVERYIQRGSPEEFVNLIKDGKETLNANDLQLLSETLNTFTFDVIGIKNERVTANNSAKLDGVIEMLIKMRDEARANKNFSLSDQIRDELLAVGIQLKDGKEGTSFSIN